MGASVSAEPRRAWLQLKDLSSAAGTRTISGLATTPETDRVGDELVMAGVSFSNPVTVLIAHDQARPVGLATLGKPTADGVPFTATFPDPATITSQALRDRIIEAIESVTLKLIRGVSIGFRPLHDAIEIIRETGGLRFLETEILELSLVVVPANAGAVISSIKSFDLGSPAAPGTGRPVVSLITPGASGTSAKAGGMKTYTEQITGFENTRAAKESEREALQQKALTEGRSKDLGEKEKFDALTEEIKQIDDELVDLRLLEKTAKAAAVAPNGRDPDAASKSRDGERPAITMASTLPKGALFTRAAMDLAAARGSISDALQWSKRWGSSTPDVSRYIKAIAGTAGGGSPSWGSELVSETNLAGEFVELLRAATIIDRIPGIRRVPFNVRIPVQTGGSTVNWVGEQAAKPVTELAFDAITLGHNKIAGIVVLTEELVRLSSPSAEETVRRDLVEQITRFMDAQFITPSITATATRPASITNGVVATTASGTDADAFYADLNTALATFDDTDLGTNSLVIIMPPALARGVSTLRNALGQFEFNGVSMGGGTLMGFPVIVSSAVPAGTIIIVKADEILMADDGMVTLDASNQATLDMAGGDTPTFNLWQKNCIGIRAERWVTWAKRRADVVALIDTAAYGPASGSPA